MWRWHPEYPEKGYPQDLLLYRNGKFNSQGLTGHLMGKLDKGDSRSI